MLVLRTYSWIVKVYITHVVEYKVGVTNVVEYNDYVGYVVKYKVYVVNVLGLTISDNSSNSVVYIK